MSAKNCEHISPSYQCITPLNHAHFKFPPDTNIVVSSVDRIKHMANNLVLVRSRRSFTPMRNSFLLQSPDLSPIEINNGCFMGSGANMNFVRLSPEKVPKVAADSTSTNNLDSANKTVKSTKSNYLAPSNPTLIYATPNRIQTKRVKFNEVHEIHLIPPLNRSTRFKYIPTLNEPLSEELDDSMANGNLNHRLHISSVLFNCGFKKYVPLFIKEGIDFAMFLNFDEEDLRKVGVDNVVDRQDILSVVDELNKM